MLILLEKINKNFKGNLLKPPSLWSFHFFLLFSIGIFNILIEHLLRLTNQKIFYLNLFHLFIYFLIPLIYFLKWSFKAIFFYLALIIVFLTGFYKPFLFLLIPFLIFSLKIEELGLNFKNFFLSLFGGIFAGFLILGHLIFVLALSSTYSPQPFSFTYLLSFFPLEAGFGSLGMELFFRGFLFQNFLKIGFKFWQATLLSTILFIGPFLTNPLFTDRFEIMIATIFYLLIMGFFFSGIILKTKNLIGCYIGNLIITCFRYFLIWE